MHFRNKNLVATLILSIMAFSVTVSAWEVILPPRPTEQETHAAAELNRYLQLTARHVTVDGKMAEFHIGNTDFARQNGIDAVSMPEEAWKIKSIGHRIVIAGGGKRGTLYGVHQFLETFIKIRFWSETEEYLPPIEDIELPEIELAGKPFFAYRNIYQTGIANGGWNFAVRNKLNQLGDVAIPDSRGGQITFGSPGHVHALGHGYLREDEYLTTHPEYFALINNVRKGSMTQGQFCLSNPELVQLVIEKLKKYIVADEKNAEKHGFAPPLIYDLSINDNPNVCQCPPCAQLAKKHGNSGVMLLFTNQVARFLKTFRPDLKLQTAAYYAFLDLPRGVKPEDNVIVRVINTVSNNAFPLSNPRNRQFRETVAAWKEICSDITVWDYSICFESTAGLPYPSEFNYGENFRFYAQNGVTGIFCEHEYPEISDMFELKTYLEAKLMDDPFADASILMADFYHLYYQQAGNFVAAYRQLLKQAAEKNNCEMEGFAPPVHSFTYIDLQTMLASLKLLEQAENAVSDSPELLRRVSRARLGADLALLKLRSYYLEMAKTPAEKQELTKQTRQAMTRLIRTLADNCNQFTPIESSKSLLRQYQALSKASETVSVTPISKPQWQNAVSKDIPGEKIPADAIYLDAGNYLIHSKFQSFEQDRDALGGIAMRFDSDASTSHHRTGAQTIGLYRTSTQEQKKHIVISPEKSGYRWFKIGPVEPFADQYLFVTNSWEGQYYPLAELSKFPNRKVNYFVQVKYEGKLFNMPGDKNAIVFGGIIIAPANER